MRRPTVAKIDIKELTLKVPTLRRSNNLKKDRGKALVGKNQTNVRKFPTTKSNDVSMIASLVPTSMKKGLSVEKKVTPGKKREEAEAFS